MNNRPRKCLGYKTPFEVFAKMTGKTQCLSGVSSLLIASFAFCAVLLAMGKGLKRESQWTVKAILP
jgi:hypothetical protein